MKKNLRYLLLAISITLTLSACFEITEVVTVNKDGSGQFTRIMDATKLSEQALMLDSASVIIPTLTYFLDSTFAETFKKYATAKGISKIVADTSKPYIYKVSLDFTDVNALNDAVNLDKKDADLKNLYSWKEGQLTRKDFALTLDNMKMEDEAKRELAKTVLEDMKYTIILNLPSAVNDMTNKKATMSFDKKTITVVYNLLDVIDKKVNLSNDVFYK